MRGFLKVIVLFLTLLTQSALCFSADVRFEAKLSHSRVQVGQRFQVSFTVNENGQKFVPPPFYKFNVLSGPNRSSSMQYVNGKVSKSLTISYVLQAKEVGTFKIGGATILINGKEYKTDPIQVEVVKAAKNRGRTNSNRRRSASKAQNPDLKDMVFVKAIVDRNKVFVGEKVSVTYKLYSRLTLTGLDLEKLPALNGFWTQDIRTIYDQIELSREQINGQVYQTAELQKSVLYPQRTGDLEIDPMEIKVTAQINSGRRRSVFDQIFGSYESKELVVGSQPLKIKVNPLPKLGRPANFSGAVGRFQMNVEVSKDSVATNEAIDFRITLKGNGNLPLISPPKLNFPPDFESYDPDVSNNFKTSYSGSSGSKSFNYLVIPRHAGEFVLKPFQFTYFDLQSKTYQTLSSDSIQISVSKSVDDGNVVYRPSRKEEVELLNADIRYIHQKPSIFIIGGELFYNSVWYYLLIGLLILLMLISYWIIRWYQSKQGNIKAVRRSKANKIAKKRLMKAKKHLQKGEDLEFYEEISSAIYGYYADKFSLDLAELSQEKIIELLYKHHQGADLEKQLIQILDDAEMARFAPNSEVDSKQLYQKAADLIRKTENLKT